MPRKAALAVEELENRITPSTYNWDGSSHLTVILGSNENLAIVINQTNSVPEFQFILTGGADTWTALGSTADGGVTGEILSFNTTADLAGSISINNTGSGAGTNNVQFDTGTISSGTITVDTTTGSIQDYASLTSTGAGSISLTAGQFIAVNANLTGGTGGTTLLAEGDDSQNVAGVSVAPGSIVTATGDGVVSVTGTSGSGSGGFNFGVSVSGSGSTITSGGGSVTVTGTGGSGTGGNSNFGVYVGSSGEITSGGGAVRVIGTGGTASGGFDHGVSVFDQGSTITSGNGGTVTVLGTGGSGSGGENHGVEVYLAGRITSGGGSVTVTGNTIGVDDDFNEGVEVYGSGSTITAGGAGTVVVTGYGGNGGGASNRGVEVYGSGQITSSGGSVDITGQGGDGTGGFEVGVYVEGTGATITSGAGGAVTVTGTSTGTGNNDYGVYVSSQIASGGNGSVTVAGTGGTGTGGFECGVVVDGGTITTGGGDLSVTGQGVGSGSGSINEGVSVGNSGTISSGAAATVTVIGNGGNGSGGFNYGVSTTGSGSKITSSGGAVAVTGTGSSNSEAIEMDSGAAMASGNNAAISITADSLLLDTTCIIDSGTGTTSILTRTAGTHIALGGAELLTGSPLTLGLSADEIGQITAGTLSIGNTSSGPIAIAAPITFSSSVANVTTGSGNAITFGGAGSISSSGNVTLKTSGTGSITSTTGATDIAVGTGTISLAAGSGGIGAGSSPLVVSGTNLDATTLGSGNVSLTAVGSVAIDSMGLSLGSGTLELNGGSFSLGGNNRIDTDASLDVSGATFALGAFNQTVDNATLTSGTISGTTGVLTSTTTFILESGVDSAILAGANGLAKSTAGTVTLTGANTYSGATSVSVGTVFVDGNDSAANGTLTVQSGATLGGTGTIGGSLAVNAGGTVSPGQSATLGGILTINGGISLANGSTLDAIINGSAAGDYGQLVVLGTPSIAGANLSASTVGFTLSTATQQIYELIDNEGASAIVGTFSGLPGNSSVTVAGSSIKPTISYIGGSGASVTLFVAKVVPVVTPSASNLAENAPSFTITGTGFDPSGTNSVVLSNGATATLTVVSATELLAMFTAQPTSTGSMTAIVTTDGTGSGSPVEVATIVPASTPTVTSNMMHLPINSSSVTVTGTGFDPSGTNIILLSNGVAGTVVANSPTELTVTFTTAPTVPGSLTAVVTTDGVTSGSPVVVATITSAPTVTSNTSNLLETATSFTIAGTGFDPSGTNGVVLSDGAVATVVATSTTQLTVTFTTQPVGSGLMTAVVTTDGLSSGSPVDVATITTVPPSPPSSPPPASPPTALVAQPVLIGGAPNGTVDVYTESNGAYTLLQTLQPFGNIPTDVRTAVGDVNGDGIPDLIFAIGPSPTDSTGAAIAATATEFKVMVLSGSAGNPVLVQPFDPFLPNPGGSPFTAGGFVSAGGFLKNGREQIVVSPDQQGGPRIAIFDMNGAATAGAQPATPVGVNTTEINPGSGLTRINNFLSVNPDFRGGARTAVGDLNGDGTPDIAIAAGFGGGPAVLVINGTKVATTDGFTLTDDLIGDFFAFNSTLRDGAYLAIGDVFGNGQQDLILGPGAGGPAEVEVLNGTQLIDTGAVATIASPSALFTPTGLGPSGSGLRVAVAATGVGDNVNVIVGAGRNMPGYAKVYPGSGFTSGSTNEPSGGQLVNPYGGVALTDGIFVG